MNLPHRYELPIDSEEARRMLNGIIMICDDGEEWYDYDDEPKSNPNHPKLDSTARGAST